MNRWQTLLLPNPDIPDIAVRFGDASLEVLEEPTDLATRWRLRCSVCGAELCANLISTGDECWEVAIGQAVAEARSHEPDPNVGIVLEHLGETKHIIQTDMPFILECDCEFRLHQAVAVADYMWHIVGKGFADDVETYLGPAESC